MNMWLKKDSSDEALMSPHTVWTKIVAPMLHIKCDASVMEGIKRDYTEDAFCKKVIDSKGMKGLTEANGLWYIGSQLLILRYRDIHENIFRLAHDTLGHFGADKSYTAIWDSYYWPNMRHDLEDTYVPGCADCQRNKATVGQCVPQARYILSPYPMNAGQCWPEFH
jgi:hypothetical protein